MQKNAEGSGSQAERKVKVFFLPSPLPSVPSFTCPNYPHCVNPKWKLNTQTCDIKQNKPSALQAN